MELLTLLTRQAPNRVFASIVLGALGGIGYALLIPIVLASAGELRPDGALVADDVRKVLSFQVSDYRFAALFVAVCVFILCTRCASQVLLASVSLDATTALRVRAYQRTMRAAAADLERIGPSRLLAAITNDVQRIVFGAGAAPVLLISFVTLMAMLGYLFFLSREVLLFVLGALIFGVITYQIPVFFGRRYFERGRAQTDALYESIRGLMHGSKELKLSRVKQERYFREILLATEQSVLGNTKRGSTIITAATNYGDLLSFFVIGAISFVFLNYHAIGSAKLQAVIMVLLYITSPVAMVLNSIPQLAMANVSLRSINRLFAELAEEDAADTAEPVGDWHSVHLTAVTFTYENEDGRFTVGPLDLEVRKGEITFIAGGNGSGKSTLGKLLTLHYAPKTGEIHFGRTKVDAASLNSCRQTVGAIFADYYLFDRLLGSLTAQEQTLVERYLKNLQLERKVSVKDGKFSTLALSEGQRRRVALLVALLEDRQMYVFDEWAADQDPAFKRVFYCEILPLLRAKGKAVVVISHDDRYFHVADRLILMEDGKMAQPLAAEKTGRYADAVVPSASVSAL